VISCQFSVLVQRHSEPQRGEESRRSSGRHRCVRFLPHPTTPWEKAVNGVRRTTSPPAARHWQLWT